MTFAVTTVHIQDGCRKYLICTIYHELDFLRLFYRVPETLPLYDILNEFQKGHSHMAVVVRRHNKIVDESSEKPADSKH